MRTGKSMNILKISVFVLSLLSCVPIGQANQASLMKSPDGISVELLQDGHLEPQEPWASLPNTGTW